MQTVENRFIAVIAIIYAVGIIGFMVPSLNSLFIWLTPVNIVGTFVVAWIFHKKWEFNHLLMIAIIGIMGFFVEMAGIKTQAIFGSYYYGNTLGTKWQGVPFLIGLNWAALVFYTSSLLAGRIKSNLGVSFLAAALMTIYDYFLEPVAVKYDFWHWNTKHIPLQNYLAWFIVAFIMHLMLNAACKPIKNKMAASLLFIQMGFFLILHIYVRLFA